MNKLRIPNICFKTATIDGHTQMINEYPIPSGEILSGWEAQNHLPVAFLNLMQMMRDRHSPPIYIEVSLHDDKSVQDILLSMDQGNGLWIKSVMRNLRENAHGFVLTGKDHDVFFGTNANGALIGAGYAGLDGTPGNFESLNDFQMESRSEEEAHAAFAERMCHYWYVATMETEMIHPERSVTSLTTVGGWLVGAGIVKDRRSHSDRVAPRAA